MEGLALGVDDATATDDLGGGGMGGGDNMVSDGVENNGGEAGVFAAET